MRLFKDNALRHHSRRINNSLRLRNAPPHLPTPLTPGPRNDRLLCPRRPLHNRPHRNRHTAIRASGRYQRQLPDVDSILGSVIKYAGVLAAE